MQMKTKIKSIFKKIVIIWTVICMLLPTIFGEIVFAIEEGHLNTERAGNYAANFAINFYDNWSSKNYQIEKNNVAGNFRFPVNDKNAYESDAFGGARNHQGYDISIYGGTIGAVDIYSVCSGTVAQAGYERSMGNYVIVSTTYEGQEYWIRYMHMANTPAVTAGESVDAGTLLGKMGSTGDSTGLHLHIDFSVASKEEANKLVDKLGDYIYSTTSYRYFFNPLNFIPSAAEFLNGETSTSTSSEKITSKISGEIKTEYDETKGAYDLVNESDSVYRFSNISWISFVYKNALFKSKADNNITFSGVGSDATINKSTFNDKTNIKYIEDEAKNSEVLDAPTLISEGKILPGDILIANKGNGEQEYLLYVGGAKIIYATQDPKVQASGALKYEYVQYYLQRVRKNLLEGHEDDTSYNIPKYGITQVYRIKPQIAEALTEDDANLFYNGKGYYSKVEYWGIPDAELYESSFGLFDWVFDVFRKIFEFLLNLIIYIIRMQVVGWANLCENLLQHVLLGISGDNNGSTLEAFFGNNGTSASGERITIESIFFNQIPILDANFFNFKTAGGHELTIEVNKVGPIQEGESRTEKIADTDNVVYRLRKNLNSIYIVVRNLSIALMLFILVAVGIRIALTSIAEKKAEYKKFLTSWLYAMCVVLFIHVFMYTVFVINDNLVGVCREWSQNAAQEELAEELARTRSDEELNLYDAIRTKAYAFNWREGVPATVLYLYLVYLLIRFSLIYFKRYLTIYILALSSSFMGVKYAVEKLLGKKTNSLNKWFKDFSFNVLLQTVHAFIYVLFMAVALSVSQESLAGAAVALVILNFMLKADSIIIKIFGLDKAGSLADVNKAESWMNIVHRFLPIYTISRGAYGFTKGALFGERGFIKKIADFTTGADNMKDVNEVWEKRKYNFIGWKARIINKTPIRFLSRYNKYNALLGKDLSKDTNKKLYNEIKSAKKLDRTRFSRKINLLKDYGLGTIGKVAAIPVMIGDPALGMTIYSKSKRKINQFRTPLNAQRKVERYHGTKAEAKNKLDNANKEYNNSLNLYTNNEFKFQEAYNQLLDEYAAKVPGSQEQSDVKAQIAELLKNREKERAKELHNIEEKYGDKIESEVTFGNAKHENNKDHIFTGRRRSFIKSGIEKVTGLDTMEDIVTKDAKDSYNASESASKQKKKLDTFEKVAEFEKEFRELTQKLKQEQKNYAEEMGIPEEEAKEKFDNYMAETVKESKKMNVSASTISNVIDSYMYENRVNKITDQDVDNIIEKIKEKLSNKKNKAEIDDSAKQAVRQAFEKKMIKDKKGLGFETKDATALIRETLGKEGLIKRTKESEIEDSRLKQIHEQLLQKINEINTFNEVAKAKHKSSLINIYKIIKDANK